MRPVSLQPGKWSPLSSKEGSYVYCDPGLAGLKVNITLPTYAFTVLFLLGIFLIVMRGHMTCRQPYEHPLVEPQLEQT